MYMLRLLLGFVSGVYVGTYYNCKPIVEKVSEYLKNNLPESKNQERSQQNKGETQKQKKQSLLEKINKLFNDN